MFQRKWYGYFVNVSLIKLTYADDKISFNIKNYNFTQYTKEIYVYIYYYMSYVKERARGKQRLLKWWGGCTLGGTAPRGLGGGMFTPEWNSLT